MAQPSNKKASDFTAPTQNCSIPDIAQEQHSHGCYASNVTGHNSDMQSTKARERRTLSETTQGHHEANSQIQFDEAYETTAESHLSSCQHSPWGCVRCNSLPFLNSPFHPTEQFYNNQITRSTNRTNQTNMQLNAIPARPTRVPRQYATPLWSSPGSQANSIPQYANMRALEQQSIPFEASATPSLSHSTTPHSIFSVPRTSPNIRQSPYDWGTPATTVSLSFKEPHGNHMIAPNDHGELYETPSKVSDVFDTQFISDVGNDNQQWLEDAELDDLNYRRGSQSAVVQSQNQKQTLDHQSAEKGGFIDTEHFNMTGTEEQLTNYEYSQSAIPYNYSEPVLGQQFHPFEPRAFNAVDLEFSNPFAADSAINSYNAQTAHNQSDSYGFNFSEPLYHSINYSQPSTIIHSDDFALQGESKQSRWVGPSRSRHTARDEDLDRKLVAWRGTGMSYKEIMAKGNFGLEESTLRGRYRTLTKSKEKRLRKPVWDDHAVSALLEAVEHHAPAGSKGTYGKESLDKIPWKRVAEWMEKERKCYLYGNATVKKKYVDVIKARRLSRRQTTV